MLLHLNSSKADKIFHWSGTDNEDQYQKNIKDEYIRQHLINNGWLDPYSITYKYNSQGFRSEEFTKQPAYVALGCSFTEGVGLPVESTWPYLLAEKIGYTVWNLGVGGCSINTCCRILEHYINLLNVVGVCLLEPPDARIDIEVNKIWVTMRQDNATNFYKSWAIDDKKIQENRISTIKLMQEICNKHNVGFYNFPSVGSAIPNDYARDMQHNGKLSHQSISNKFKNIIELTDK